MNVTSGKQHGKAATTVQYGQSWNEKGAMDQLYNKRQQNYQQAMNPHEQQYYRDRMAKDRNIAEIHKRRAEGEAGRVPWGTGFANQTQTSAGAIGSHY
jgi:hypothetical protein